MMLSRQFFAFLFLLALGSLAFHGCGDGDDGGGNPQPQACSITVTSPASATIFKPGNDALDDCNIRWDHAGLSATVDIDLYKGATLVGAIARGVDAGSGGQGVYFWEAENLGADNGADFQIRVSATDEAGCFGESEPFSLINTEGCYFAFTNSWAEGGYTAGDNLHLTWRSGHTTGNVNLELHTEENGFLGSIAEGLPNSGSYDWTVDSFHHANDFGHYRVKVMDHQEDGCFALGDTIRIVDPDICTINVVDPALNVVWQEGDQHDINLVLSNDVNKVDLRLYVGDAFLAHIALDLPVSNGTLSYTWTVNDTDQVLFGNSIYRIRAINSEDGYCVGTSDAFTILGLP